MKKTNKIGDYEIPFNRITGEYLDYVSSWNRAAIDMVPNFIFGDTLRVDSIYRGRSAAHFIFISCTTGKRFSMFMKDMMEMVKTATITNGEISALWTFQKRGESYGIRWVGLNEDE